MPYEKSFFFLKYNSDIAPDKIPDDLMKNFIPELPPSLVRLVTSYLKENISQIYRHCQVFSLFLKMLLSLHPVTLLPH